MSKTVVLVGSYEGYSGPEKEVWGVNRAYTKTPQLSRLYFFDSIWRLRKYGHADFVKHINKLKIPIYAKCHYATIPLSKTFPLREIEKHFGLMEPNFTSTIAYMIAHAMYEGYERIIMHKMLMSPGSIEYYCQKACLDFWLGMALGRGIEVVKDRQSFLMAPHLWEPGLYGYMECDRADKHSMILHKAIAEICHQTFAFTMTDEDVDHGLRLGS